MKNLFKKLFSTTSITNGASVSGTLSSKDINTKESKKTSKVFDISKIDKFFSILIFAIGKFLSACITVTLVLVFAREVAPSFADKFPSLYILVDYGIYITNFVFDTIVNFLKL